MIGEVLPASEIPLINAAVRLALEAEKVCGALAGDKLVDGLRAALNAFSDAYDERVHR